MFTNGTVSNMSSSVKSRGPLVTHAGENFVPVMAPTNKHTSPESEHASSINFKGDVVLGVYSSNKGKKRKSSPQSISRPLKQKSGKEPRLIQEYYAGLDGVELGDLGEFLDPSMMSTMPPSSTSLPEAEAEYDSYRSKKSLQINEETETEANTEREEVSTKVLEVAIVYPAKLQIITTKEQHPKEQYPIEITNGNAIVTDTRGKASDENIQPFSKPSSSRLRLVPVDASAHLNQSLLENVSTKTQTIFESTKAVSQAFTPEKRIISEKAFTQVGAEKFLVAQSQQNAYLIIGYGKLSQAEDKMSYLEKKISYFDGADIEIATAKKKRDLAIQCIDVLETDLANTKVDA